MGVCMCAFENIMIILSCKLLETEPQESLHAYAHPQPFALLQPTRASWGGARLSEDRRYQLQQACQKAPTIPASTGRRPTAALALPPSSGAQAGLGTGSPASGVDTTATAIFGFA